MSKAIYNSGMIVNPSNLQYVKGIDNSGNDCISVPSGGGGTDSSISTPIGTIIPWMGDNDSTKFPDGFLLCDGSAVSRTTYADLFSVVGTKFGEGDGSTTFNLPQLTDARYLQGNTTAGTQVAAGLPNISGSFAGVVGVTPNGAFSSPLSGLGGVSTGGHQNISIGFDASKSNSIYGNSDTVTPKSLTTLYLICYKVVGGGIIAGGSGGVINGERYTLSKFDEDGELSDNNMVYITPELNVYDTTTPTKIYQVQHDCALYIGTDWITDDETIHFYLDSECKLPIFDQLHRINTTDPGIKSDIILLKSGSSIYIKSLATGNYKYKVKFIEYKLQSLNPQVAFPDYDVTATAVTNNWTAPQNGWLIGSVGDSSGAYVKINDKEVMHGADLVTSSYSWLDFMVPISSGQVVTFSNFTLSFYPAKAVESNSSSYVVERKSGTDSTGYYNYTLWSDGYCELEGRLSSVAGPSGTTIIFPIQFRGINYVVSAGSNESRTTTSMVVVPNATDWMVRGYVSNSSSSN